MSYGHAYGVQLNGLISRRVRIEAWAEPGDGSLTIEGLPQTSNREARVRLRSALGFDSHRVRVSVLGALPFDCAPLDLAMAAAAMRAMGGRVHASPMASFIGEVGLDGQVRPVRGALVRRADVVPAANTAEVGLSCRSALAVRSIDDIIGGADSRAELVPSRTPKPATDNDQHKLEIDIRRKSRVLLIGTPGSGRTHAARTLLSCLSPLNPYEWPEVAAIYSTAGLIDGDFSLTRPFRAPHHTVSEAGLFGGGAACRPGEVSLAHCGVLLLDELTEFRSAAVKALASYLKAKSVVLRAGNVGTATVVFPAHPAYVVGTAHPCPCGYHLHPTRCCKCSDVAVKRYQRRTASYAKQLGMQTLFMDQHRTDGGAS